MDDATHSKADVEDLIGRANHTAEQRLALEQPLPDFGAGGPEPRFFNMHAVKAFSIESLGEVRHSNPECGRAGGGGAEART